MSFAIMVCYMGLCVRLPVLMPCDAWNHLPGYSVRCIVVHFPEHKPVRVSYF